MQKHRRQLDASIETSGPHDFTVRFERARPSRPKRPSHPAPNVRDDRDTPLIRARDAGSNARDLPDVTSKSGCDRLARRANQPFADEPKTPDVNDQSSFPVLPAGRAHATVSRLGNAAAALKSSIVSCLTLAVVAAEAIISGLSRLMQHPGITEIRGANGHDR